MTLSPSIDKDRQLDCFSSFAPTPLYESEKKSDAPYTPDSADRCIVLILSLGRQC